ncbi:MAG: hypothetical protein AABX73_04385 [Nanoarchaeota archaeon]
MERQNRVFLTFVFIVLLVTGLYIFTDWFSKVTGYFSGESERGKIVLCLKEKGAELYGSEFCADCEKQRKIFGEEIKSIFYVDCGRNKELCPNIREIPAWYIDRKIYYGLKSLSELKEISECEQ